MKAVVSAACLLAAIAGATTLVKVELSGLTAAADSVVRGKVVGSSAHWTGDHRRIVTEVQIDVAETLKGAPTKTVTVQQPGGVVGDIGQQVDGLATFTPGEEVVVFLERRGPTHLVVGMAQGKFRVERTSDGKGAYAIPEDPGDARVLDPATHQEVKVARTPLALSELSSRVRALAKQGKKTP